MGGLRVEVAEGAERSNGLLFSAKWSPQRVISRELPPVGNALDAPSGGKAIGRGDRISASALQSSWGTMNLLVLTAMTAI